ncbi:MAG: HD-GYP domain-containing protein [Methylococcales bacterium]|nr:HD-GYP domain-containing protein [Methylococcales bacterium]
MNIPPKQPSQVVPTNTTEELIIANKELAFQNEEKEKRAEELVIANKELAFQNKEKGKRAEELVIANKELAFQNKEKGKRAEELVIANKELAFQNKEKGKRAEELVIANKELAFQNKEKGKRAEELIIANKELAFQNEEKEKRAEELVIANKKLQSSLFQTISLARQLGEMRDPYTAGHEENVGKLAAAISAELGFDLYSQEGVLISGYLHDLGKIIIPTEILSKPSKLSNEEYALIKLHVEAGYAVLKDVDFPWSIARAVREHHERMDGSGYPYGLSGDEISIEGRILSVADTVDAITSHRPYRAGLGIEAALNEIKRGSGSQYDTTVVNACIKLFSEKGYEI